MNIESTSCCAVEDINDLSSHNTPELAMREFCLGLEVEKDYNYYRSKKVLSQPAGFYIFTGVVRHSKGSGTPRQNGKYAPNFAAYILKHKLGSVVETTAHPNRVNHPDHWIKVYVWHPNETNLRKWWKKNG